MTASRPPNLPAGWSTATSGPGQSNWVTSTVRAIQPGRTQLSPLILALSVSMNSIRRVISVTTTSAVLTFHGSSGSLAVDPTSSAVGFGRWRAGDQDWRRFLRRHCQQRAAHLSAAGTILRSSARTGIRSADARRVERKLDQFLSRPRSICPRRRRARMPNFVGGVARERASRTRSPPPARSAFWNFDAVDAEREHSCHERHGVSSGLRSATLADRRTYFAGNGSPEAIASATEFTMTAGLPTSSYSYFAFALTVANGSGS